MKVKKENLIFRFATEEDAEKILKIYKPYVENTTITFVEMRLLVMPTLIKFGVGLLIGGMQSFLSILMTNFMEMELGKSYIKF